MFKKGLVLVLWVLLLSVKAQSQTETGVHGIVVDQKSRQPIEFATITLLLNKDSSMVKQTVTDNKGRFVLENITPGNYLLRYGFIGYNAVTPVPFSITQQQKKLNLGTMELVAEAQKLADVVVSAKRNALNASIDRKVYNVEQDIMSKSGSISDVLKNIPAVEVDIDGNLSLRGSGEVMVLINGRPSPLMGKTKAEVLQQLPANSVEKIEVITNPSAKYRPDGTAGIINIVLKKNAKTGLNGTITANAGNRNRANANITLNYNPGKYNLFGSYSIRQDNRIRTNTIDRVYLNNKGADSSLYHEQSTAVSNPLTHVVVAGLDYTIDKYNSFGISGNYFTRNMTRSDVINKYAYNLQQVLVNRYDRLRNGRQPETQKNLTAYYLHKFKKEDHELRIEFNTSASDEVEDNRFSNVYYLPKQPTSYDNTIIKQGDKEKQLTVEYTNPIGEDAKLEAGYMGSFNRQDLDFYGEYFDTAQGKFIKDIQKTNRFIYDESIHAVYATYQQSLGAFGFSAGIRAEQVNIKGNLVTLDSMIRNNYFKVYPTLHLSYKLNNKNELQLNYSRRVNRPDPDQLNPFPEYQDPRNLRAGNPKLLPEMIHSIEFGYKWQSKSYSFIPSVYYRLKENGFTSVTIPVNDSTLLSTSQNLASEQSAGVELILSVKAVKFLTANVTTSFFYNQIDASNLGYSAKKSTVAMSMNANATVTLSKTTMLQLSTNYRSSRLTPQGEIYPNIVVNAGLRQDLFKGKVSLMATVSDLFKSLHQKAMLNTAYLKQTTLGTRDPRIFYMGISYRFGVVKKAKEEKLQFDNSL